MNKLPFTLGPASKIAVSKIDASLTMGIAVGGLSQFICIGLFNRGTPNKAIPVSNETIRAVLGTPIHPTEGAHFEHYRHVYDATLGGNGYVINVQRKGMMVPALTFAQKAVEEEGKEEEVTPTPPVDGDGDGEGKGEEDTPTPPVDGDGEGKGEEDTPTPPVDDETIPDSDVVETRAFKANEKKVKGKSSVVNHSAGSLASKIVKVEASKDGNSQKANRLAEGEAVEFTHISTPFLFGEDFELSSGAAFALRVIDGDKSDSRFISIEKTKREGEYLFTVRELNSLNVKETVESFLVSFDIYGQDQEGEPNFIATVLENESRIFNVEIGDLSLIPTDWEGIKDVAIEGGDDGDMKNIEPEAWENAIKAMNDSTISYNAVIASGVYDLTALVMMNRMADDMRVDFFFDISPRLNPKKALETAGEQAMESSYVGARYYYPYKATDPFSQVKVAWGLSGAAFKAKADGIAKNVVVGGYHYSPAGEERAMIIRTGITPLSYANQIDAEKFAEARINIANAASDGGMCIDDALTTWGGNDDLRFQHVASTVNAFSRQLVKGLSKGKHNPDGLTRETLDKSIPAIADQFVASGALVTPNNTAKYGDEPYKYQISKNDKDLWEITTWLCVTGVGRRFLIRPVLLP